jgi:hypothetical protein
MACHECFTYAMSALSSVDDYVLHYAIGRADVTEVGNRIHRSRSDHLPVVLSHDEREPRVGVDLKARRYPDSIVSLKSSRGSSRDSCCNRRTSADKSRRSAGRILMAIGRKDQTSTVTGMTIGRRWVSL